MKYKVTKKQSLSTYAFVSGVLNDAGVKAKFFEMETGEVVGIFTAKDCHQSYPGRIHGGVSSAILDEVMGRSIMISEPDTWSVTVELEVKYKKPALIGEELKVIGKVISNTKRVFESESRIILPDGETAVVAYGKYVKLPLSRIADDNIDELDKFIIEDNEETPEYIEY